MWTPFVISFCIKYNYRMSSILPSQALVLVAVMKSPRDLEIARLLGWYRIPLRKAPKVLQVDYLAFYQTSAFGAQEGSRIQWVAAVRGLELVYRRDLLRDEPDHPAANEEYYKIQIDPLCRLAEPVRADNWRRLTFLYTTGEYLNRARTLKDLVLCSEERQFLWRSLRERALNAAHYSAGDIPDIDIDPSLLEVFLGIQEIEEDNHAIHTKSAN